MACVCCCLPDGLMSRDADLIDKIYEAAVIPDMWPSLLHEISQIPEAVGGILFATNFQQTKWIASQDIDAIFDVFVRDGWMDRNQRPRRLAQMNYAGFVSDLDVFTEKELDEDPVYSGFLRPNDLGWAAGTMLSMPSGDHLVFSFEKKFSHGPVDQEAVRRLDALRPDLARSGLLSWRLGFERARAMTQALEAVGLPAAVLRLGGRLTAANASFQALIPTLVADRRNRLAMCDSQADEMFKQAFDLIESSRDRVVGGRSIPLPATGEYPPMVFHLLPVRRAANDIFSQAVALLVVTPVDRQAVPMAELLQGLFDLTPAEARIARGIGEGQTVEKLALQSRTSPETVRSQLKSVLKKVGVSRQAELVALLSSVSLRSQQ